MGAVLKTTPGPTYAEMRNPALLPADLRRAALARFKGDELHPLNLFNITWRNSEDRVRHVVLPRELTGVAANIVVLLGRDFPSGSHKVGPAYATLMEGELAGEILPGPALIGHAVLVASARIPKTIVTRFMVTPF